jgi:hypothetical protein
MAIYHSDRNPSTQANANAALINEAGEVLGDPWRRRQYDDYLNWERPEVLQGRLLNIRAQIDNARNTWGKLFEDDYNLQHEGKSEILKYIQENPDVPFDTCVAHVLVPKAQANRDTMRADILKEMIGFREAQEENSNSKDASHTIPPTGLSRPQPNAPVQQSTSSASTWSVRILGVLLVGAGVVFVWWGDGPGSAKNGWFVLVFWVCILSAIYCFHQSGLNVRWLRWLVIPIALLAGPLGWVMLLRSEARSGGFQLSPGFFRWLAIGVSLFFIVATFIVMIGDDHQAEIVGDTLALVAVCWVIGLSGPPMARAAIRWFRGAAVRGRTLWLAGLAIAVAVALTIGPLWSLVVLAACGVLLLMRPEGRP